MREKIRIPLARNRFAIVLASLLVLGAFAIAPALVSASPTVAQSAPAKAAATGTVKWFESNQATARKTSPSKKAPAKKAATKKAAKKAAMTKGDISGADYPMVAPN